MKVCLLVYQLNILMSSSHMCEHVAVPVSFCDLRYLSSAFMWTVLVQIILVLCHFYMLHLYAILVPKMQEKFKGEKKKCVYLFLVISTSEASCSDLFIFVWYLICVGRGQKKISF